MLKLFRKGSKIAEIVKKQPEHRKLRKRNPEKRAAQKLKRRNGKVAQFTVDRLEYTSHAWFTVPRIRALGEHIET